jgi:acetyl esterase
MLIGLPPALLISAGLDPLFPQYNDYAVRLREAGVDAEVHNFEDADHGFILLGQNEDKIKAREIIAEFIEKHIST